MSNLDDFVYFGGWVDGKKPRKTYLNFCLTCGTDYEIKGHRYLVSGAHGPALLLDKIHEYECPHCRFPVFTACTYKQMKSQK